MQAAIAEVVVWRVSRPEPGSIYAHACLSLPTSTHATIKTASETEINLFIALSKFR
jgi:hypothetical protein